jgi:hypothetical protein
MYGSVAVRSRTRIGQPVALTRLRPRVAIGPALVMHGRLAGPYPGRLAGRPATRSHERSRSAAERRAGDDPGSVGRYRDHWAARRMPHVNGALTEDRQVLRQGLSPTSKALCLNDAPQHPATRQAGA